jgi:hypothetical protein
MTYDIISAIDPTPYYNGFIDFFFPQPKEEVVLSRDEKLLIVDQINTVKLHLDNAKLRIDDEDFDNAIEEVGIAIEASTCGKCKKKMLIAAYDINHASSICALDGDRCTTLKDEINDVIKEFVDNYLPRVEEVLSAREN